MEITEILGGYKKLTLTRKQALKLIEKIIEKHGETLDLHETIRMLENFNEFINYQIKRSQSYLTPSKNTSDLIKGRVVIDKLRLAKNNEGEFVTLIFDKRVNREFIEEALKEAEVE